MEKVGIKERKIVITELTQGRELANELKNQLFHPFNTSSNTCDFLLEKIVSSYDNALALLDLLGNGKPSPFAVNNLLQSPNSKTGTPRSNGSDPDSKNQVNKDVSKKRKTMKPRCSAQVRVFSGSGLDDGYSWRKYGQKDILGANHPRAYYRCTHRNTQGCLATKQVQQTDEDPSIFEVIYRGNHSCILERMLQNKENLDTQKNEKRHKHSLDILINNEIGVKFETPELDSKEESFSPFSFPSTPIESDNMGSLFFAETSNFTGANYLPQFLSPETSESYFSTCQVNDLGVGQNMQSFESDFAEIISNSTTNSSFGEWDFSIDQMEFDHRFLDVSDCFS